jgi:type IV pilus assembly protein PilN
MIKINLLPHREERRKQQKNDFYTLLVAASIVGALILILVGFYNASQIFNQNQRNYIIKTANDKLDGEIKEIATLKEEIDSLKARQQAVEDLQGDRNQPVYLLSELVTQTPEGIYLRSVKQDGQKIILMGYAQSNERVSEYLNNLGTRSKWLVKPELIVINSAGIGQGKDAKKVFDFTINVEIKRPRDQGVAGAGAGASSGNATGTKASVPAIGQVVKPSVGEAGKAL